MELRLKSFRSRRELLGQKPQEKLKVVSWPLKVWVEEVSTESPILYHTEFPRALLQELKEASKHAPVSTSTRASGLKNTRAVYGVQPRIDIRANCRACRFTKATFQDKAGFEAFSRANELVSKLYQEHFPAHFEKAVEAVESQVHKDWRWNNTPYLSINCNFNQTIAFHVDSGNQPSALSTVLIASENVSGGELDLPELGLSLAQKDGALTLFRGDLFVHGVRPFQRLTPSGFRASIVFYTLENMKVCQSFQEELKRANALECGKAKERFTAKHKLKLLKQAKSFFKPERFQELCAEWEKKAEAEEALAPELNGLPRG